MLDPFRISQLWLEKVAKQRADVGLFVPLPKALARKFPSRSPWDDSPVHMTLLICGDVSGREGDFIEATKAVFKSLSWNTITATLSELDSFPHDETGLVHIMRVDANRDLLALRQRLLAEYRTWGFDFPQKYVEYKPHVTLCFGGTGPDPVFGEWEFDHVEIWNLSQKIRVPLGKPKTAKYKEKKVLEDGTEIRVYGPRQVSNRHKEKAHKLENLKEQMGKLRAKVQKDLDRGDDTALVVALIDETFERVGNPESADNGHFGVTGWRKKHLSFRDGKAILKYVGKSGVSHEKEVTTKKLVDLLKKRVKGLKDEDELFPSIQSEDVNEYLSEFGATAKDIRGFHANETMKAQLKKERAKGPRKLPFARKEKDEILKEEFKRALETTAELVGHEAATLKSQYLVPGLEDSYLHDGTVMKEMVKKTGTKTPAEREDDQVAKKLRRKDPKCKPPRLDLRKHAPIESRDKDLEGVGGGDNGDKDLQRKVARMVFWMVKAKHSPGEVWDTDAGFRAMNDAGNVSSFDTKEEAEAYAHGDDEEELDDEDIEEVSDEDEDVEELTDEDIETEEDSEDSEEESETETEPEDEPDSEETDSEDSEEDSETPKRKPDEPESDEPPDPEEKRDEEFSKEINQIASKILKGETQLGKSVSKEVDEALSSFSTEQKQAFKEALQRRLEEKVELDGSSPEMIRDANRAVKANRASMKDPEKLANSVADLLFAKKVTANPLLTAGRKVSNREKTPQQLADRAKESFQYFKKMDPELIDGAAETLNNAIRELGDDKESPRAKELQALLSGLHLASIVRGDKGVPGKPEPSHGMVKALQSMVRNGESDSLFQLTSDLYDSGHQKNLRGLMSKIPDEEFFGLVSNGGKSSAYDSVKEAFSGGVSPEWKALLKNWMVDDYMREVTWQDTALRDTLKQNGEEVSAQDRAEKLRKMRESWKQKLFEEWQDCMGSTTDPDRITECKDRFSKKKQLADTAKGAADFLDKLMELDMDVPNTTSIAALKHVAETGTDLDAVLIPHPEEFSKTARFSPYRTTLASRGSLFRGLHMKNIKVAKQKIGELEAMADWLEKRASSIRGVSEDEAVRLARGLDKISTFLELQVRQAGYKDTVEPTSNYTLTPKMPTNFDPEDIGAEDDGALLRDEDEPYDDVFVQDEFNQLREVQQKGMFSNAKAAAAAMSKLVRLVQENGIPIRTASKKKRVAR